MKKIISSLLLIIYSLTILLTFYVKDVAAAGEPFRWVRGYALDNNLSRTTQVANDEALLEWDVTDAGVYTFSFYTENERKNVLTFTKTLNTLDVKYQIFRWDGTDFTIDVTQSYIQAEYKDWDFASQTLITPTVVPTEVVFHIDSVDSQRGRIFKIENQYIKFFWSVSDSTINVNFKGLKKNTVHPFELSSPGGSTQKINVLKNLSFDVSPTHYINVSGSVVNLETIDHELHPNENAGQKPGIKIEISRPIAYNSVTAKFDGYIPLMDEALINLSINLQEKVENLGVNPANFSIYKKLSELTKASSGDKYYIDVVKSNDGLVPSNQYTVWSALKESTIYDPTSLILSNVATEKYDFDVRYIVTNGIGAGYTYLSYDIARKSITDTYAVIDTYNGPGIYTIYVAEAAITNPSSPQLAKWAEQRVEEGSGKIYIPLSVVRNELMPNKYYTFKVEYRLNDTTATVASQLRIYDANADHKVTVSVPKIVSIQDLIVIPKENTLNDAKVARFNLVFEMPDKVMELLSTNNKQIWYEFCMNTLNRNHTDSQDPSKNQKYQIAQSIYLKKNGSQIELRMNDPNNPEFKIVDIDKPISCEIVLKGLNQNWISFKVPDWSGSGGDLTKPVSGSVGKYIPGNSTLYENDFFNPNKAKIPASYFVTLRALYDEDLMSTTNEITMSEYAIPISIALSETQEILKAPIDVKSPNKGIDFIETRFTDVEITEYKRKMLDSIQADLDKKEYEVFLSASQGDLQRVLSNSLIVNKKNIEQAASSIYNFKHLGSIGNSISIHPSSSNVSPTITEIRNGAVIAFRISAADFMLLNLDANQNYYMAVRTSLDVVVDNNEDGVNETTVNRYSEITNISSVRTGTEIVIPGEEDKIPGAPQNFGMEEEATDRYIHIRWEEPEYDSSLRPTEILGYEIIRVADNRLETADRSNKLSIADLYAIDQYKDKEAFRIIEGVMQKWNQTSKIWEVIAGDLDIYEYVPNGNYMRLKDFNINTNRIYYYYIRTVRYDTVLGHTEIAKSMWAELTSTTKPVQGVKNLKQVFTGYAYNDLYEVVVSFESPIIDSSRIPSEFEHVIAVRSQDSAVYSENGYKVTLLAVKDEGKSDYRTYVYKIGGLLSGKKYYVKAAILDKTTTEEGNVYAKSAYTPYIELRTTFSQEDYDKENKYADYSRYYDTKTLELINVPAFVVEDSASSYELKYIEEKFTGLINATKTSYFDLPVKKDVASLTYFISQKNIQDLQNKKMSLRIVRDNLTLIIPYEWLDSELTEAWVNMKKSMKDRNKGVSDFYVRLSLTFNDKATTINGAKKLGAEVETQIELIEQNRYNVEIDYMIEERLKDKIKSEKSTFLYELDRQLKGEINDNRFLEIMDDTMEDLAEKLQIIVAKELPKYEEDSESVVETYKPINMKYTGEATANIVAYNTKTRSWYTIQQEKSMGNINGYMSKLERFALTSVNDFTLIYGTEEEKAAAEVKAKYNLDAVLRANGVYDLSGTVTQKLMKEIVYVIIAKRASSINEEINLRKQIDARFSFLNQTLTNQEIIYTIMQTYNMFTSIDINNLIIKDQSVIVGITGIQNYYKQSILASVELGMLTKNDIKEPNKQLSVGTTLRLIRDIIK